VDTKYPSDFLCTTAGNYWKGPSQVHYGREVVNKGIWSVYCSGYSFGEHVSARGNAFITSTDFVIPAVAKRLSGIQVRRRFTGYMIATPSRPV
jgi:hypothetical protein